MQDNKDRSKVSFIHSVTAKLILATGLAFIVVGITLSAMAIRNAEKAMTEAYKKYTMNVAQSAATAVNVLCEQGTGDVNFGIAEENSLIDLLEEDVDGNRQMLNDYFKPVLGDIELSGISGSYAYFVSADGMMVYHSSADKIGNAVENAAVKNLTTRLSSGEKPASIGDGSVVYEYKGADKFAGYAFTNGGNIVVVTGDYDLVMEPIKALRNKMIVVSAILIVISLIAFYVIITLILRPIVTLIEIINATSRFDLRHNPKSGALCKRKDEFGLISEAVRNMRAKLREIVDNIDNSSGKIDSNVGGLDQTANYVNAMCTDNSATTEQVAASMQECTASTDRINTEISNIQNAIHQIEMQTNDGFTVSDEIMERATELKATTENASRSTNEIFGNVKTKSDHAIESSRAVEKINKLTETIMSISSQTSLLALNASIEAARAGEAGRGFAVVATEIGNLADDTSKAVANINDIVREVNDAVSEMQSCLEEMGEFIENTVLKNLEEFSSVGVQYQDDADIFKDSMSSIKNSVDEVTENMACIVDSINAISSTIGESADGVSDIAMKTTDIVQGMGDTEIKVGVCREYIEKFRDVIHTFIIE